MANWVESTVPENQCPWCGHELDAVAGEGSPSPGDWSVCISCAQAVIFNGDLSIRAASTGDFAALSPLEYAELQRYQRAVRQIDRREFGASDG